MVLEHRAQLISQIDTTTGDDGWAISERTDLVCLVCNCGYDSGWTDPTSIQSDISEHMATPLPGQPSAGSLTDAYANPALIGSTRGG